MDISAFNALKAYGAAQQTLRPDARKPEGAAAQQNGFDPAKLAQDFAATLTASEGAATAYMTGKADPHSVVEALAAAEIAVETAVTLRNKVVEAYQELLRMPI
jgi:flagellar hook-basal body complex protein FliE